MCLDCSRMAAFQGWMKIVLTLLVLVTTVKCTEDFFPTETCGTRPMYESAPQPRIFNGQDAVLGAWPWIGYINHTRCLAVLIDEQWATTVASCQLAGNLSLILGDTEYDGSSPHRQEIKIARIYTHPEYIFFVQNDIVLLQLERPVDIDDYVRPICINRLVNEMESYKSCWIAGSGVVNDHELSWVRLQEAPTQPIPHAQCQEQHAPFGLIIDESFICGLTGGQGEPRICLGDAGSPMMCSDDDGRWYVLGQASIIAGSCGNNTSIFSRISQFTDFIDETVSRVTECSEPDYRCNDGIGCVFENQTCDTIEQCPGGEDEQECPSICICLNGGTCNANDECECPDGFTGTYCETVECGEANISIPVGSSVNLSSPFYPDNYEGSLACQWTINVMTGYKVLVEFIDFDIYHGLDFLRINDTQFTGNGTTPANYTSVSDTLDIQFITDSRTNSKGFLLQLSAIDVSGIDECEWYPCENNGTCVDEPDGYLCECEGVYSGRICHAPDQDGFCGEEDIVLDVDDSRNLTSFNYPGYNLYQLIYSCKWIVTAPPGRKVRVEFMDLQLYPTFGLLTLNARAFTGYQTPQDSFISDDERLEMVFNTQGILGSLGFHVILSDYLPPDGDECASQPCQHGARCFDYENGFVCKCRQGFTGKRCQNGAGISPCGRNSFQCNNGRCIKASNVCDKRNHCGSRDRSDELNCDCEFNCHNGRCIPERYVCDKNNNCGDWSDEYRPDC